MTSKLKIIALLIFISLACGLSLRAMQTKSSHGNKAHAATRNLSPAKILYEQNCARCHGADGRGQTSLGELYGVPDLTDAKRQRRASDKTLANKITRGRGGMPSFAKKLSKEEINSLVSYVRKFKIK